MKNPIAGQPLRITNYAGSVTSPAATDGFRDANGNLIDPSTVSLKFKDPTGAVQTVTFAAAQVVKDAIGLYHYDIIPAVGGSYVGAWSSTGPVTYEPWTIDVDPAPI